MSNQQLPMIYSYVEFGEEELPELRAQFTGETVKRQRVGTLGFLNKNYQVALRGSLDEWLKSNVKSVPMYIEHNDKMLPAGKWTGFELDAGKEFYAMPEINTNTTAGSDLLAAIEAGDIRGISWGIRPRDLDSYQYKRRTIGGKDYMVLSVTNGILMEISAVVYPADRSAGFKAKEESPIRAALRAVAEKRAARRMAVKRLIEGRNNG